MKHTKISLLFVFAAAGLSGLAVTGCNSMDGRNEASVAAAADTDASYLKLNATLTSAIARLEAVHDNAGSPENFLNVVMSVQESVSDDASTVAKARADLKASGDKQVARMQEESAKINNPDLAKDFVAKSEKLRGYYADYDKESADLGNSLDKGYKALNDAKVAVAANPTDSVVKLAQDSVSKAISALSLIHI